MPAQSVTLFVIPAGGGPVNQPPVANVTATPTSGTAPLAVTFNGSGSSDPDGSIASYAWTFGDGGTATGVTTTHTYQAAGTYTAVLTVTDNQGATDDHGDDHRRARRHRPAAPSNLTGSVGVEPRRDAALDRQRVERERLLRRARGEDQEPAVLAHRTVGANVRTFARTETAGQWVYRVQAYNGVGARPRIRTARRSESDNPTPHRPGDHRGRMGR